MTKDSDPTAPDLVARLVAPEEQHRATYLFRTEAEKPPADARFIAAVRAQPVERFTAAAAVWPVGEAAHFLLARQPGQDAAAAADALIPALEAFCSRASELRYGRLLASDDEWAGDLARNGFQPKNTERVFEVAFPSIWNRIDRMLREKVHEFPVSWRLTPITKCPPETVWPLIAPYRLISFDDLRKLWHAPPPMGYSREYSVVLFDGNEPIGAFLTRKNDRCVAVDIRVVKAIPARLRALANVTLMSFIHRQTHSNSLQTAVFRADELSHRETANLARRLGGKEVSRRHNFVKPTSA